MESYRYCPPLTKDKKENCQKKSEIWVKFFTIGCVFYRVGDWGNLQIDPHVSLHDGFKIQFTGIVPVFLEFNVLHRMSWVYCIHHDDNCKLPFCHLLSMVHTKQHDDATTGSREDVRSELKSVTTKKAYLHGNNDIMKN